MTCRGTVKTWALASFFTLLSNDSAHAGLTGAGYGEMALAVLFPYVVATIQVTMAVIWLALHVWSKATTGAILIVRTFIDVIFILFSLYSLTFMANISQYRGYWQSDLTRYCRFYSHSYIFLIIPLILALFIANKWLSSLSIKNRAIILISFLILFFLLSFVIVTGLSM